MTYFQFPPNPTAVTIKAPMQLHNRLSSNQHLTTTLQVEIDTLKVGVGMKNWHSHRRNLMIKSRKITSLITFTFSSKKETMMKSICNQKSKMKVRRRKTPMKKKRMQSLMIRLSMRVLARDLIKDLRMRLM